MKLARYATMLAAAAGLFVACQKLDEAKVFSPEQVVSPVLHALPAEIAITAENMGEIQTFTWDAADFGVLTQINYSIEAAVGDEAPVVLFSDLTGTSTEQPYESINTKLVYDVEVEPDTPTAVNFYVSATIGTDYKKVYSEPVSVTMTVTKAERVYPTVWVIGDYCGWSHDNSQFLFSFLDDEINYEGVIDFGEKAANGFKLTGIAGWDDSCNWGLDGEAEKPEAEASSITLISSGGSGNIDIYSKRFYRFAFDRSSLTLTKSLSFDQLGIVGDGVGSWDNDLVMEFDAKTQRFWVDATLVAGEIKFRLDGAWDTSFGSATEGMLDSGGDNIKVPAGNYRIYVNLNNSAAMTYELNAEDYGQGGEEPEPEPEVADWYIHGQTVATPEWGPTAMESASDNIAAYRAANVEVAANSEFLFKSGDESQWIGADASLAGGDGRYTCTIGAAFAVSANKVNAVVADAGTYDYWLLPDAGRAYVMAAGVKPEYVPETWGIVGNLTGWGDLGDFSLSEEGAYLVRRGVVLKTTDEFKIRYNNAWDDSKNYGTASGGAIDINTAVALITSGGSQNMKVQLDGTYDIYFDLAGSTLYVMSEGKTPADAQ
ncbi:SusE domain-containing protein [uncultured Alistipes sp.]|uniref:SusE domain-containing protein n=1 Tax=uncultured Alistipes sp. TaxID=538949 RepID=UPI0028045632|nr:SusE domain-containing protein [uncultured Alistipes sp.]